MRRRARIVSGRSVQCSRRAIQASRGDSGSGMTSTGDSVARAAARAFFVNVPPRHQASTDMRASNVTGPVETALCQADQPAVTIGSEIAGSSPPCLWRHQPLGSRVYMIWPYGKKSNPQISNLYKEMLQAVCACIFPGLVVSSVS